MVHAHCLAEYMQIVNLWSPFKEILFLKINETILLAGAT